MNYNKAKLEAKLSYSTEKKVDKLIQLKKTRDRLQKSLLKNIIFFSIPLLYVISNVQRYFYYIFGNYNLPGSAYDNDVFFPLYLKIIDLIILASIIIAFGILKYRLSRISKAKKKYKRLRKNFVYYSDYRICNCNHPDCSCHQDLIKYMQQEHGINIIYE